MADITTIYQLNFTGDQINDLLTRINNLDIELNNYLLKNGGAMTGSIAMGGNKVTGLSVPKDSTDAATKGYVDLAAYPVGAIYISTVSTSPASLFGGAWEQLKDRFLLGAGDTYSAGSTGGEAAHTLTEGEMPSHTHTITAWYGGVGNGSAVQRGWSGESTSKLATTSTTGGGTAHNNMPPYLSVYMWKRVA